jgi:DNA repair ATPase RecN
LKLETIKNSYDNLGIESYEYASLDVLYTIESEIDQLTDLTFDLMKNKMTLSEFYESVEDSIDSIESDLEDSEVPNKVEEYAQCIVKELLETKDKILIVANK